MDLRWALPAQPDGGGRAHEHRTKCHVTVKSVPRTAVRMTNRRGWASAAILRAAGRNEDCMENGTRCTLAGIGVHVSDVAVLFQ